MGLEHDVEKFMDMTKCLRELSREMLDESRLLKDQDRKAWYEFKLQAKKTCPLLMKYEHAWPLGAYMHRYLYDLNMRRNNERVFGTSVAVRGGASDGDEDEPSDEGILDEDARPETRTITSTRLIPPPTRSEVPFVTYLRNLRPPLDQVSVSFIAGGVTDETSFRNLSNLHEGELNAFLREDLGLTAYQVRQVRTAIRAFNGGQLAYCERNAAGVLH